MTSEVITEKPDGCSLAEYVLMNAEENKEQDLVEEFVDIGVRVTEHIMTYLGGQKADKRIAAACRFFSDRESPPQTGIPGYDTKFYNGFLDEKTDASSI